MKFPTHPLLYEINTRVWLKTQQKRLNEIPLSYWQDLKNNGFDLVWLMGIWTPSPTGQVIAQNHPGLQTEYAQALPDWKPEDIVSSPYAVGDYLPNSDLVSPEELIHLKQSLESIGLGLILDFVPNHTAIDHPWVTAHPEYYISRPSRSSLPDTYFFPRFYDAIAYGRDPNYAPWTDTAQLNYFKPETRQAMIEVLTELTKYCHGLRCDMAMLILNNVFADTWIKTFPCLKPETKPTTEFWQEAISQIQELDSSFLFIAESYWNTETQLQDLGFAFTYDKGLYDLLKHDMAWQLSHHLQTQPRPEHWVRFIENHDEARAARIFSELRSPTAALTVLTLPGLKLLHDGQLEGRQLKQPVQLVRQTTEAESTTIHALYNRLFKILNQPVFKEGIWKLVKMDSLDEQDHTANNLSGWMWTKDQTQWLIIVNPCSFESRGWLKSEWPAGQKTIHLEDHWQSQTYEYPRSQLQAQGLYINLQGYQAHVFEIQGLGVRG